MPVPNEASVLTTKSAQLTSAAAAIAMIIATIVVVTAAASTRIATPDLPLEPLLHGVVASTQGAANGHAKRTESAGDKNDGRSRSDKFFFGFLEFDWDPDAPGGVPGFGPYPPASTLAQASPKP